MIRQLGKHILEEWPFFALTVPLLVHFYRSLELTYYVYFVPGLVLGVYFKPYPQ